MNGRREPVRVYQGARLRHESATCDVYATPTGGVMLKFCAADMTVDLPPDVVRQIVYAANAAGAG